MKRIFITIYVLMVIGLFAIPFGIGPIIDAIFEDEAAKLDRDIARGTFYLISRELEGRDREQIERELNALQQQFGYPLGVYHKDDLDIATKDRDAFLNHLVVEEEVREMLVMLMEGSDLVLTMGGPFPGEELEFKVILLFCVLFVVALIVPALGWTYFVYRDIKKIEAGSSQFAMGDHGARVQVSKISALVEIASAFNHMAEKSQKFMESQRETTNSLSHEIRTPLARIKFSREMLLDMTGGPDTPAADYLAQISKDVDEIESLVDEMLTFARFGRERDASEVLTRNEIVSWLNAVVIEEGKSLPDKTIRCINRNGQTEYTALYEPVYLGWAVRNLIRNAALYSGRQIEVSFEGEAGGYHIHVDDDGPGIPDQMQEKIFQPFFRMDKSRSRKSGGYGLGLAIAKRIAIWHGGDVSVGPSLALGGARFTLSLPK